MGKNGCKAKKTVDLSLLLENLYLLYENFSVFNS